MESQYEYDVYFYEAFEEEEAQLRRYLNTQIKVGFTWRAIQESAHDTPPAALISTRTQSIIPEAWGLRLKGILSRSTGYDHILRYRAVCGNEIAYGYLPLYCHRAVAEQAMMLWMSLLRKLPAQLHAFQSFHRDGLTGRECRDKTLLVVGVGNIGYQVADIGKGLGMKVIGVDIVKKHGDIDYVNIGVGMEKADVIVCAMNLTKVNRGYFSRGLFERARPGVVLVNIARGELTPTGEMLYLVKKGILGGLALDVFENESDLAVSLRGKQPEENTVCQATLELRSLPNVIFTPHNAFNTEESVLRKSQQSAEQVQHFLEKGFFLWNVAEE